MADERYACDVYSDKVEELSRRLYSQLNCVGNSPDLPEIRRKAGIWFNVIYNARAGIKMEMGDDVETQEIDHIIRKIEPRLLKSYLRKLNLLSQ